MIDLMLGTQHYNKVLSVEHFMIGMVWTKMFIYEFNKSGSYFSLTHKQQWIVIDEFTFSILPGVFLC